MDETVNTQDTTANVQQATAQQDTTQQTPTAQQEKTYTQAEFDSLMGKTRRATEAETERQILKSLGVDSKEKLTEIKAAYETTLSKEEKMTNELQSLQNTAESYKTQASDYSVMISAMEAITGKSRSEVEIVVKMAKGLVSEAVTIEEALNTVIGMTSQSQEIQGAQNGKPSGFSLIQPDMASITDRAKYETQYKEAKTLQDKIRIKNEAWQKNIALS